MVHSRPKSLTKRRTKKVLAALVAGLTIGTASHRVCASESGTISAVDYCCNVVELRQYTLHAGRRDAFIELFDSTFAEPLDATGMTVIGQFLDLDRPERFVWMRGFQSMEARRTELAAFYDGDLWRAHRSEANASIDDSDNVLLLEPASYALRFRAIPPRLPELDAVAARGLIVATLYYTRPEKFADFGSVFETELLPLAESAGARTLAAYKTSGQANNFPRLPIRLDEHVFVWVTHFSSQRAYANFQGRLGADKRWTQVLWPVARGQLTRDPEVLRLLPTPRSRVRG